MAVAGEPFELTAEHYAALKAEIAGAPGFTRPRSEEFVRWVEGAISSYLAIVEAIREPTPGIKPAAVRRQIGEVKKHAERLVRSLGSENLSNTALWQFPDRDIRASASRILADADAALASANRWRDGRLPDYAMQSLALRIAHYLRDVSGVEPLSTQQGTFGSCLEIVLEAAGVSTADHDFTWVFERAREELDDLPEWQAIFPQGVPAEK